MKRFDKVEIPEGLPFDSLLRRCGAKRKDALENDKAGFMFILHVLTQMTYYRKYRDFYEEHGGYPIHSTILNSLIGKRYTYLLDILEAEGVIERSTSYSPGNFSKVMRLKDGYATRGTVWRSLPASCSVTNRIKAVKEESYNKNQTALSQLGYITKWFDTSRLLIDTGKAHALIEYYRVKLAVLSQERQSGSKSLDALNARITMRVNGMINTIHRLQQSGFELKRTGKDKRLHSTLTNTKKALRRLYTFDGKPLVSIDIKASQPYFLTQLLKPESWKKNGLVQTVFPELYKKVSKTSIQQHLLSLLMFGGSAETLTGQEFLVESLASFNWENDFYQSLVDRANLEGLSTIFPNRSEAKKKTMLILFNDAWYAEKDEAFQLFAKWYPKEAALISFLKNLTRSEKEAGVDTPMNYLPVLLQRIESYFVLEHVCKLISLRYPDAPILPVHDCILTVPEYKDAFKQVIEEALIRLTGVIPGLTVEEYTDNLEDGMIDVLVQEEMQKLLRSKHKAVLPYQGLLKPLLKSPPDIAGSWLVSDRYIVNVQLSDIEKVFYLIDDTQ